jgi:hypothetical protein
MGHICFQASRKISHSRAMLSLHVIHAKQTTQLRVLVNICHCQQEHGIYRGICPLNPAFPHHIAQCQTRHLRRRRTSCRQMFRLQLDSPVRTVGIAAGCIAEGSEFEPRYSHECSLPHIARPDVRAIQPLFPRGVKLTAHHSHYSRLAPKSILHMRSWRSAWSVKHRHNFGTFLQLSTDSVHPSSIHALVLLCALHCHSAACPTHSLPHPCLDIAWTYFVSYAETPSHLPPLWSSGQSSCVRFPVLPDYLSSSGSGTGSTQPL